MPTYRVDLNDDGDFATWLRTPPDQRRRLDPNGDYGEFCNALWDWQGGIRRTLWRAYPTKRGGTTIAFEDEEHRDYFVKRVQG